MFSFLFLPQVSLDRHQSIISDQLCSKWIVHPSPGRLLIRSCSTNGLWSSAHLYCSDSPHPVGLPSSSLGSGLLTLPSGGRDRESLKVCSYQDTNSTVGPHLSQNLQGGFFRLQVLQRLICALWGVCAALQHKRRLLLLENPQQESDRKSQ